MKIEVIGTAENVPHYFDTLGNVHTLEGGQLMRQSHLSCGIPVGKDSNKDTVYLGNDVLVDDKAGKIIAVIDYVDGLDLIGSVSFTTISFELAHIMRSLECDEAKGRAVLKVLNEDKHNG